MHPRGAGQLPREAGLPREVVVAALVPVAAVIPGVEVAGAGIRTVRQIGEKVTSLRYHLYRSAACLLHRFKVFFGRGNILDFKNSTLGHFDFPLNGPFLTRRYILIP